MANTEVEQSSKRHILAAAESLFAAKGFEGCSVDAIAKQAGVNKATIYYYFSSKQAILDCIIEEFLQEFIETSVAMLQSPKVLPAYIAAVAYENGDLIIRSRDGLLNLLDVLDVWLEFILDYFLSKRNVLRIMVMESAKDGDNKRLLFRFSDLLASPAPYESILKEVGISRLSNEMVVIKFFGSFLPYIYYAISANTWEAHYGMPNDVLRQGLRQLFRTGIVGYFQMTQNGESGPPPRVGEDEPL